MRQKFDASQMEVGSMNLEAGVERTLLQYLLAQGVPEGSAKERAAQHAAAGAAYVREQVASYEPQSRQEIELVKQGFSLPAYKKAMSDLRSWLERQ